MYICFEFCAFRQTHTPKTIYYDAIIIDADQKY